MICAVNTANESGFRVIRISGVKFRVRVTVTVSD